MVGGMLFVTIVGLMIAVLWILMPFAIFGTKGVLRELLSEQRRTNQLLERIAAKGEPTDRLLGP